VTKDLSFAEKARFYRQQASLFRTLANHAQDEESRLSYTRLAEAFETEEQIASALTAGEAHPDNQPPSEVDC
jgi:hypothetical protein